jgi:multiple sugar transport system substrate-binding protein/sn-glycerol 3-phosphate transport system substrate-binding protein
MRTKTLLVAGLLLIAVLVLAACAPVPAGAPAPAATEAAEGEAAAGEAAAEGAYAGVDPSGQTVVWWHNHSGSREENMLPLIEEYNQSNAYGITVEAQNQGSYNDIRDKVNASIAAGEAPAALIVGYQNDQSFYQLNDTLVDLNTLIDDATWGLSAEDKADFYQAFLEQSVNPLFDNQRLGFPPNRSMEVIFYNQTWLEELGFSGPPTTPAEFKEMACAASAANGDGTGGFILRDDASAMAAWTFAFGGDIITEDGLGYIYNSPATVEAMTFLKDLYDSGCAYFFTEGFPNPQFAARKGIFAMGSTSGIPFYAGDVATFASEAGKEPDVWGVAAVPHTTAEPVQNVYGGDVMIVKTTPEQELAAWDFVKWFTTPEVQARWVEISGYFPTRAGTSEFFSDAIKADVPFNQGVAMLPYSAYEPQFISYTAVRDAAEKAFNEIMQGADIQTTLDSLTTFANDQERLMQEEMQ